MNRYKAEEERKRRESRAGLSAEEIKALDHEEARTAEVVELARSIHSERFPEEYDLFYDSIADANDRAKGRNPMSAEYIAEVDARRAELGVTPLAENGLPVSNDSWEIAYKEAETRLRG